MYLTIFKNMYTNWSQNLLETMHLRNEHCSPYFLKKFCLSEEADLGQFPVSSKTSHSVNKKSFIFFMSGYSLRNYIFVSLLCTHFYMYKKINIL